MPLSVHGDSLKTVGSDRRVGLRSAKRIVSAVAVEICCFALQISKLLLNLSINFLPGIEDIEPTRVGSIICH